MHIIDIETIALPDAKLEALKPEFAAPSNYKDPEKIEAYKVAAYSKWKEEAALSPMTGQVAMIGVIRPVSGFTTFIAEGPDTEASIIESFWDEIGSAHLCGWNIKGFDLPFLIQRSWINGIRPPMSILFAGRYFSPANITDLMEVWSCYSKSMTASLADVAKVCGVGEKTGTGAEFGKLWATDRAKAVEYCEKDCELTLALAKRLGVL